MSSLMTLITIKANVSIIARHHSKLHSDSTRPADLGHASHHCVCHGTQVNTALLTGIRSYNSHIHNIPDTHLLKIFPPQCLLPFICIRTQTILYLYIFYYLHFLGLG